MSEPKVYASEAADRFCFTCDHEIRQDIDGLWVHLHEDEVPGCPCLAYEDRCEPW